MYLLDADALIQAASIYYRHGVFPCVWRWLDDMAAHDNVRTISYVYGEIQKGGGQIANWLRLRRVQWVMDRGDAEGHPAVQGTFGEIADYVQENYPQHHVSRFLMGADPWLIAVARHHGHIVVTREARVNADSKKIKIPNVCSKFKVSCIDLFDLFDRLGANFV